MERAAVNASLPMRWSRPTPSDLAGWVRKLLDRGVYPTFTAHAGRDRLAQRGISYDSVMDTLRKGYAYRADKGSELGEWKVNLSLTLDGGRDAIAVCLVRQGSESIIVLTVMWADRTYLKP